MPKFTKEVHAIVRLSVVAEDRAAAERAFASAEGNMSIPEVVELPRDIVIVHGESAICLSGQIVLCRPEEGAKGENAEHRDVDLYGQRHILRRPADRREP
jgi:hypothetical protein